MVIIKITIKITSTPTFPEIKDNCTFMYTPTFHKIKDVLGGDFLAKTDYSFGHNSSRAQSCRYFAKRGTIYRARCRATSREASGGVTF